MVSIGHRKQSVAMIDLSWACAYQPTQSSPLLYDTSMVAKVLGILIWRLEIKFSQ